MTPQPSSRPSPDRAAEKDRLLLPCCAHCACQSGERVGHDDTCSHGCNDNGENDDAQIDALVERLRGDWPGSGVTLQMLAAELVREGWRNDS